MNAATMDLRAEPAADRLDGDLHFSIERPPTVVPSRPQPVPSPTAANPEAFVVDDSARTRVLRRLLAMADAYLAAGSIRHAQEMYLELSRCHPGTAQAAAAEDRLFAIADRYELAGELRLARALYDQLI